MQRPAKAERCMQTMAQTFVTLLWIHMNGKGQNACILQVHWGRGIADDILSVLFDAPACVDAHAQI